MRMILSLLLEVVLPSRASWMLLRMLLTSLACPFVRISVLHCPSPLPVSVPPSFSLRTLLFRVDLPALAQEQSYRYLGVPIGLIHNIDDIPNIIPQLIKHLEILGSSLLAPWQKLNAIRTFIQLCLTYALRAGNPEMQSLDVYKSTLVRLLRDICTLPASSAYFFAGKRTHRLILLLSLPSRHVWTLRGSMRERLKTLWRVPRCPAFPLLKHLSLCFILENEQNNQFADRA